MEFKGVKSTRRNTAEVQRNTNRKMERDGEKEE